MLAEQGMLDEVLGSSLVTGHGGGGGRRGVWRLDF